MDSLLLLGIENKKLFSFLEKLGYQVTTREEDKNIPELLKSSNYDLIVLEDSLDIDSIELCKLFRTEENTKQVPILYVGCSDEKVKEIAEEHIPRVTTIGEKYKISSLVSKISTELRLRKFAGANEETASIGEINSRLRELNDRFSKELSEARDLQMSLVPNKLPKDKRLDIACSYQPLEEVGGDWFYIEQLENGKISVQIADVTGHGLSAAFIACITKLALIAAGNKLPGQQLSEMNRLMEPVIPNGKFVTIFSYLYDPNTGILNYARGGHPPAILIKKKTKKIEHLKGDGFAIGFFDEAEYTEESTTLEEGDILMVYTDVLPESQNMKGDTYDYDRMSQVLLNSPEATSSATLLQSVLDDFDEFREGRMIKDDVTVIVMKVNSLGSV